MTKVKLFGHYINFYVQYFGLYDWEVNVESQNKVGARASSYWHEMNGAQIVTFCYTKNWIKNKLTTKEEIRKVAFHEIMELLLAKLRDFSESHDRHISNREIDKEIHRIIRIFENRVYKLIREK